MKRIYITPDIQTVELEVKRMVMLGVSGANQDGLSDTTKEQWDPDDEVDW